MWNNFYYNTGTGGGGPITINRWAPFYGVTYVGESDRLVFYKRPDRVKMSYVGVSAQKVSYVAGSSVKVAYRPRKTIKITLICQ